MESLKGRHERNIAYSVLAYIFGISAVLLSIYSQYFFPLSGALNRFLLIYGFPILVITLLYGTSIIRRAFRNNGQAFNYGLAYWGVLSVVAYLLGLLILNLIIKVSPESLLLLDRPNPVIPSSPESAWIMALFSVIIIAPAEEYIFRGFVFGKLLKIFHYDHWLFLSFFSSVIFAFVHLYYLLTFGVISSVIFINIIAIGMALSITYYASGGNLLIPTLLHGFFDAAGFLDVATGTNIGSILRLMVVILGVLIALFMFVRYIFSTSSGKVLPYA